MKLFYKFGVCFFVLYIVLCESGLDFILQSVDLVQKWLENGEDYLLINLKGQVLVLLLDDDILFIEGVVIMQYIVDQVLDCYLLVLVGLIVCYQIFEWLNYVVIELYKSFILLFCLDILEDYKFVVWGLFEKKL